MNKIEPTQNFLDLTFEVKHIEINHACNDSHTKTWYKNKLNWKYFKIQHFFLQDKYVSLVNNLVKVHWRSFISTLRKNHKLHKIRTLFKKSAKSDKKKKS